MKEDSLTLNFLKQDVSEDIWVHETECGFRMVSCLGSHCKRMLFLDLESHIRMVHK